MDENTWLAEKERIRRRIKALRQEGICYSCRDFETGELFGKQEVIYEDDLYKVVLEIFPRMRGHTIVIFKPHREDISELLPEEVGPLFELCMRVVQALKEALGAEKVYMNTMCDGGINHLHIQLFPRYPGEFHGSKRFVIERGPLINGAGTAARIRSALQ
ncbi:MAG: HIT family protein [Chloroflexota bacterium]